MIHVPTLVLAFQQLISTLHTPTLHSTLTTHSCTPSIADVANLVLISLTPTLSSTSIQELFHCLLSCCYLRTTSRPQPLEFQYLTQQLLTYPIISHQIKLRRCSDFQPPLLQLLTNCINTFKIQKKKCNNI